MMEHVTPQYLVTIATMMRDASSALVIFVEGGTDVRLFERFRIHDTAIFLAANGKPNAVAAMLTINARGMSGVAAIVDSDYDQILGIALPANIFTTDFRDIDCMIIGSEAAVRVCEELGTNSRIAAFRGDQQLGVALIQMLVNVCGLVGAARLRNERARIGCIFDSIEFDRFIDKRELVLDKERFVRHLHHRSAGIAMSVDELTLSIDEEYANYGAPDLKLVAGHDLQQTFALALRFLVGSLNHQQATREFIAAALRLAYGVQEFSTTNLYAAVNRWSRDVAGTQVFN